MTSSLGTWDRANLWHYRARLMRVIDGDTIVVLCDTGFYGRHEVHVRIADLHAPEIDTPKGMTAKAILVQELALGSVATVLTPDVWPLRVITRQRETVVSEVRTFERFVGDVLIWRSGAFVDVREIVQARVDWQEGGK